ncbi:MAG: hypothetical protein JSR77_01845 [Planctomycetes bacterium]|nr:hypothetical protein [Planctomycetota bacterium]
MSTPHRSPSTYFLNFIRLSFGLPSRASLICFGAASIALSHTSALAQVDPSGIEFVTVGAPGNPAYAGPDNNNAVTGRGSVGYEYRIGKTEVTTAQ